MAGKKLKIFLRISDYIFFVNIRRKSLINISNISKLVFSLDQATIINIPVCARLLNTKDSTLDEKNTSPHYNLTRSEPNRKPDRHGANQINPIDNPGTLHRMTHKKV